LQTDGVGYQRSVEVFIVVLEMRLDPGFRMAVLSVVNALRYGLRRHRLGSITARTCSAANHLP